MEVIRIVQDYHNKIADSSISDLPLIESPVPTFIFICLYIVMTIVGPMIMSKRRPFSLTSFMHVWNVLQAILSAVYVIGFFTTDVVYWCPHWKRSLVKNHDRITLLCYYSLLVRFLETVDTAIFVLRKKTNQLTYLHVYHHAFNIAISWIIARYKPGGAPSTLYCINYTVHFLMYGYYLASSTNISYLKSFARLFKRYMTLTQMGSFLMMLTVLFLEHYVRGVYDMVSLAITLHVAYILLLFIGFYKQEYKNARKSSKKK